MLSRIFLVLLLVVPGTLLAEDASKPSHKKALLIFGEEPEDYLAREATIQGLTTLLKEAGYRDNRIAILKNGSGNPKTEATKANILTELELLKNVKPGDGQDDRELFLYASLRAVTAGEEQFLICPSNGRTLDYIDLTNPEKPLYKADRLIRFQEEFIKPINQSPVERRLLILNTLAPSQSRGGSAVRERGVGNLAIQPTASQAFGQIVINDSLRPGPGTVNSFVDILRQGVIGYADSVPSGNRDNAVEMNELLDYVERFGNMASPGSVKTVFKGQDYAMNQSQFQVDRENKKTKALVESLQRSQTSHPTPPPNTLKMPGKWYCLLFAVNQFEHPEKVRLSPLDGTYNDMRLLEEKWLRDIPNKEIVFLTDRVPQGRAWPEGVKVLKSTQQNFNEALADLAGKAGPDGFLLVATACHGVAANHRSFLCPYDLQEIPFHEREAKFSTESDLDKYANDIRLISIKGILDKMGQSKAGKKLLLLDACRNVEATTADASNDFLSEFKPLLDSFYRGNDPKTKGLAVVTSCSIKQEAKEWGFEIDGVYSIHGVFLKHFIDGLDASKQYPADSKGGNLNGWVSLNEAYNYAFSQVQYLHHKEKWKTPQTPELFRGDDWFYFPLSYRDAKIEAKTDNDYLFQQAALRIQGKDYPKSREILTHLIETEPNHSDAYLYRGGVSLAESEANKSRVMEYYQTALNDYQKIGQPLDLYTVVPQQRGNVFLHTQPAFHAPKVKQHNGTDWTIHPWQKISVTEIDGDWLYVLRSGDNASQDGIGWVHRQNVTWSEQSVEQYRPATSMVTRPTPRPGERIERAIIAYNIASQIANQFGAGLPTIPSSIPGSIPIPSRIPSIPSIPRLPW